MEAVMQASEYNAVKEAIALRLSIHKAAEKIIENDYDVTHLTDNIMTLVLNWANPVHADYAIKPTAVTS